MSWILTLVEATAGLRSRPTADAISHIRPLTSLRFFAAYAVLLYHVPYVLPGAFSTPIFPYGNLGVGFFFVLSGFILAHTYGTQGELKVIRFYVKRFARVYPLHLATFAIWCSLFYTAWGNSPSDKLNSAIPNLLLLQAFFATHLFILGFNAVSWSLSVEAFFYLLFPLVRTPHRAAAWCLLWIVLAAIMVSTGISQKIESVIGGFYYFNPIARLFDFCFGILCCLFAKRLPKLRLPTLCEVVSLAVAIAVVGSISPWPEALRHPVLAIAFGQFVIIISRADGLLGGLLSLRLLVLLGEASYSLYLVHHMLMRLLDGPVSQVATGVTALLVASGVMIVVSVASYLLLERWARARILAWHDQVSSP